MLSTGSGFSVRDLPNAAKAGSWPMGIGDAW
jgi:hypothetical protein